MGVLIPLCGPVLLVPRRQSQGADGAPRHSSTRAALIYQHATRDRDKAIALALGDLVREVRTVQPDQAPEAAN
jgi:hypothetical protein